MAGEEATAGWLAGVLAEHGRALTLYARSWCDCPEDVVQESLLELVEQRRQPDPLAPWLYRVVRNRAISAGRSERRRAEREKRVATREAWFDSGASRIDAEEAATALASLSLELREVMVARIWGSLKFSEIAELVGTSLSTAQRRYEQGLLELQARLEKPRQEQPPLEKTKPSEKTKLEKACPNIDPNTK